MANTKLMKNLIKYTRFIKDQILIVANEIVEEDDLPNHIVYLSKLNEAGKLLDEIEDQIEEDFEANLNDDKEWEKMKSVIKYMMKMITRGTKPLQKAVEAIKNFKKDIDDTNEE